MVREAIEQTATRIADVSQPEVVEVAPAVPAFRPLTKSQWATIAPLVLEGKTPRTKEVLRGVVDGIRWLHHHKAAWNAIPAEYGASTTCWRWFSRWTKDGTWAKVEGVLGG